VRKRPGVGNFGEQNWGISVRAVSPTALLAGSNRGPKRQYQWPPQAQVLTNGRGTGINRYIDDTVNVIGAGDVLTVTNPFEGFTICLGAVEYGPDEISTGRGVRPVR
jgi:hypothetical protein